jgi:hypothetical protein
MSRAAQYPYSVAAESSLYPWMRERLRTPPARTPRSAAAGLAHRRELSEAERYGQALAQVRAGRGRRRAHAQGAARAARRHHRAVRLARPGAAGRRPPGRRAQLFERAALLFPRNVPITSASAKR